VNLHAAGQHLKAMPNTECLRIADQLHRAFEAEAWHGPNLRQLLTNVTAEQASAHPLKSAHSIWELTLHIDIWAHVVLESLHGVPLPKLYGTEKDWPAVVDPNPEAWKAAMDRMFQTAGELSQEIGNFSDERLMDIAPGRKYSFYQLLHGVVQHSLYHAGQIAIVKKAIG
jgi:hypothetical protein